MMTRTIAAFAAVSTVLALATVTAAPAQAVTCPTVAVDGSVSPLPTYGADWSGCDLDGADLLGRSLAGMSLVGASLVGADLSVATVSGTDLSGADLTGADLTGVYLTRVTLAGTTLASAQLLGARGNALAGTPAAGMPSGWTVTQGYLVGPTANLSGARLDDVDLSGRDLSLAGLYRASLAGADLSGTNLSGADLAAASLVAATLSSTTDLSGADLTLVRSGGISGSTIKLPAAWTVTAGHLVGPFADLSYADLRGVSLAGRNLTGSELGGARLSGVSLEGATLATAGMRASWLDGADLDDADLRGADLSNSYAAKASMQRAQFDQTTNMEGMSLDAANLTGATGLVFAYTEGIQWSTTTCPDGKLGAVHLLAHCLLPLDTEAPAVSVTPLPAVSASAKRWFTVSAQVDDGSGSGIAHARLRWRTQLAGSTSWSGYSYAPLQGGSAPSWIVNYDQGRRYCVSVQAVDLAANASAWTAETCTTAPLDDDRMLPTGPWTRDPSYSTNYYWYSRSASTAKGASLKTRTSLRGSKVVVLGTSCSGCGSVAVYVGTTKVGTVSLAATITQYRRVWTIALPASRSGVVSLVVTSSGKKVQLDAVAMLP